MKKPHQKRYRGLFTLVD